ncbi:phosphate permease [Pholiota conissans]|uniref:Phosphate permease n=1 Tax=Pholiota conissans TaxID=109636 RepID=A0A9P5YNB2_9AGAR|nr:phosphate permease [Pholiota conissans]
MASSSYIEKTPSREIQERAIPANSAYELDARRRAELAKVDKANFSWFHAKVCIVAGVGFFTDSYDIFVINIASTMLGYVYGKPNDGSSLPMLSMRSNLGLKIATPVGTLMGQLLFGWLADRLGRKKMYGVELMIMIVATVGQAICGEALAINIIGVLINMRELGFGVGGDYPLSAMISSEFASTKVRGRMMTTTFAFQGWGNFSAALVGFIITATYKSAILESSLSHLTAVDSMWRLLIGLGAVPGVFALYFRLTIPETPRFTMDIARNIDQATNDIQTVINGKKNQVEEYVFIQRIEIPKATWRDFREHFGKPENLKILFGTAYSWFALDIAVYGFGLNSTTIFKDIGFDTDTRSSVEAVYENLYGVCMGNLILSAAGLIPGFVVCFLLIDKWGRKPIQLVGFTMLAILFLIMGFGYDQLTATPSGIKTFVFLYCLANFFQNFGPNTTTFIIPGGVFPTRYRSTAHGISAASGKLGAIIAQILFNSLEFKTFLKITAFFILTGIGSTLLLPETMDKTLEELSNENQEGFVRGFINPMVLQS